eukprot:s2450_g4.t1
MPASYEIVFAMYQDFFLHFRAFETWHLSQRNASLQAKYEGSLSSVFMDLRDQPKASIDHLWQEIKYQVLAIDSATNELMLDQEIPTHQDALWFHVGASVQVLEHDGAVCRVSNTDQIEVEDEIVQRFFISDVNDVLTNFSQHWSDRWNLLTEITEQDWTRIVQFTQAFLPKHHFHLPPLQRDMWRKAVKRFKLRAARGPDGFSRLDLINMPGNFVDSLSHMFESIENTEQEWPSQLLFGTVLGVAKCQSPHEVQHYRPIALFSILFRCWAKLRTKHMLLQLMQHMPIEAVGFLPHREAAEVWFLVQSQIEVMLASGEPFCGLSSDVKRAFNHIGRRQVFHLGAHLGLPPALMRAWQKFLFTFQRRFDVRGCFGPSISSNSGFPEGDPLSIVAMLQVNWGYHCYMKVFAPAVQT